ncbi:MAG: hypothetical protein MJZ75_03150 [Paludibacteraceae bacterium]|nr:hypothetical protein [Paludibacteraceae bacterium]
METIKLGVIGKPSDWLIASEVDYQNVADNLGITLVDIPIERVTSLGEVDGGEAGAMKIYDRLKEIVSEYQLSGLTLRCFDLLTTVKNTGCLALSKLNDEGIPAACEGDIPTLITMLLCQRVTGCPGFQCNPARIADKQMLFAHCTIPLTMCQSHELTTHFESGIGVAIHGELPIGDYTLVKLSGDLKRLFAADVKLIRNQYEPNLCRTQVQIEADERVIRYFMTNPIANHHVLVPGHFEKQFSLT